MRPEVGAVKIKQDGKTYTGTYHFVKGRVTVHSGVGTKATHADSLGQAVPLARILLGEMVTAYAGKAV
jgi:recombinational DNA repair protein RecR